LMVSDSGGRLGGTRTSLVIEETIFTVVSGDVVGADVAVVSVVVDVGSTLAASRVVDVVVDSSVPSPFWHITLQLKPNKSKRP